MRAVSFAVVAALLVLAGCSDGDDPETQRSEAAQEAPPVRGEIQVSVEPLEMEALPAAPEAGTGVAVLGEKTYTFAVTFCDSSARIGAGKGEGVEVNWDLHENGDHRVNIRTSADDGNWVRGGPAEGDWDTPARLVRFAGAFVPFRATDGDDARPGGIVVTCPAEAAA